MTHRIAKTADKVTIYNGADEIVWSEDRAPILLLPEAYWLELELSVAFPDFVKRNAYAFDIVHDDFLDMDFTSCASFSTIPPQEWGPAESSPYTLADETLGSVPSGVDYLDIRVTLSRTNAPTNWMSFAVVNELPTQETFLPGGSMRLEVSPGWTRIAWIGLSGTNVILRRWQSTHDTGGLLPTWTAGNAVYSGGGAKLQGWTHGGGTGSDEGRLAQLIEGKGPGGNVHKERGAFNACSLTDTTDFSSTWTGTAVIRPGVCHQ